MRILVIHNRYAQRGGEDTVVDGEVAALRARGHEVYLLEAHNVEPAGVRGRASAARTAIWSASAADRVREVIAEFGPDVAHVHNHAYELSASVYPAVKAAGVPIVATLHNYRMMCSNAYLLRDARPCEACVDSSAAWHGLRHKCFRGSRTGSAMLVGMQLAWHRRAVPVIDRFIALTQFARDLHVRAGIPADRIVVRPNTIVDLGPGPAGARPSMVVFVGRLEASKGVRTLLNAWGDGIGDGMLVVAGSGPLEAELRATAPASVRLVGQLDAGQVARLMRGVRAVIVPSHWYEGFPMVVLESFAASTPVVASRLGSLAEIVGGDVGWTTPPATAGALRAVLEAAIADPVGSALRGAAARAQFEQRYSQRVVMHQLERIYHEVCGG